MLPPARKASAYPINDCAIFLDCIGAEGEEYEEKAGGHRGCPPEEVRPAQLGRRDENGRELPDSREVGVYVGPADPRAQAVTVVEVQRDGDDDHRPEHLDERHGHQAEVAGGREPAGGVGEVPREYGSSAEEVDEGEACGAVRSRHGRHGWARALTGQDERPEAEEDGQKPHDEEFGDGDVVFRSAPEVLDYVKQVSLHNIVCRGNRQRAAGNRPNNLRIAI